MMMLEEMVKNVLAYTARHQGLIPDIAIANSLGIASLVILQGKQTCCPDASFTENESFMVFWTDERHHFEIESFADGHVELFRRDGITGELWGAEGTLAEMVAAIKDVL